VSAPATPAALSAARAAYYEAGPRPSLRAIAEECGVPYARLLRVAKEQEWEKNARIRFLRRRIAEHTEQLAKKKAEAARSAQKLLTAIGRGASLQALHMVSGLGAFAVSAVADETTLLASFQLELRELETGRRLTRDGFGAVGRLGWKFPADVVNERNRRRWEKRVKAGQAPESRRAA